MVFDVSTDAASLSHKDSSPTDLGPRPTDLLQRNYPFKHDILKYGLIPRY